MAQAHPRLNKILEVTETHVVIGDDGTEEHVPNGETTDMAETQTSLASTTRRVVLPGTLCGMVAEADAHGYVERITETHVVIGDDGTEEHIPSGEITVVAHVGAMSGRAACKDCVISADFSTTLEETVTVLHENGGEGDVLGLQDACVSAIASDLDVKRVVNLCHVNGPLSDPNGTTE
jgi:hypothetical protein